MRIECGSDLQQWRQQLKVLGAGVMLTPEVLYGTGPVNIGDQPVVT